LYLIRSGLLRTAHCRCHPSNVSIRYTASALGMAGPRSSCQKCATETQWYGPDSCTVFQERRELCSRPLLCMVKGSVGRGTREGGRDAVTADEEPSATVPEARRLPCQAAPRCRPLSPPPRRLMPPDPRCGHPPPSLPRVETARHLTARGQAVAPLQRERQCYITPKNKADSKQEPCKLAHSREKPTARI